MVKPIDHGLADRLYRFEVSAEFNQFYLKDELAKGVVDWNEDECWNNFASDDGLISVGTNCDRIVPVEVYILNSEPPLDLRPWDHLVECTIAVPSGCLLVGGCFDDCETAGRIELNRGTYIARLCYGNQYCDDHECCADYYVIKIWQSNDQTSRVIKRRIDISYDLIS